MGMTRRNTRFFYRRLYAGEMETVTLLKAGDDQAEGQIVAYQLFNCRRNNLTKSGEAIAGDMPFSMYTQWLIPSFEINRVGVNYLNVLDRIVDKYQMWWQPESGQSITMGIFDNYWIVATIRVDPFPNSVLIGIPGINL